MTKWKCEGCRHRCSIETNAHTPMLFCGMGLLEWMKVETAEEWLDLEDTTHFDPMNYKIGLPDTSDGIEGYELKERIELLEHWDAKNTEDIDDMKERIEKLEVAMKVVKNDNAITDHDIPMLCKVIKTIQGDVEELKKKAHEHPSMRAIGCQHEWTVIEPYIKGMTNKWICRWCGCMKVGFE